MGRAILRKNNPIQQRLVEIGRCYKGEPKATSQYGIGKDYASAYFRFEPAERFKLMPATVEAFKNLHEELQAGWDALMGDGAIKIRFPHSTIDENYQWSNKVVKAIGNTTKTFRECDGSTCSRWVETVAHPSKPNQTIPKFMRGSKPCAAVEGKECPEGCQARGLLKFMVPDLYPGGIILFPMNAPTDVAAIASYLEPWKNLDLSAIPFSLFRMKAQVSWEEKGEMKSKDNWGLHLEIDPVVQRLMLQGVENRYMQQLQQGDFTPVRSLPPVRQVELQEVEPRLRSLRNTEDGMMLEQRVQEAIQQQDIELLEEAVSDARELVFAGLYDRSSQHWIDREEKRGRESIAITPTVVEYAAVEAPVTKEASAVKPKTNAQRLKDVAAEVGVSWDEAKRAIAAIEKLKGIAPSSLDEAQMKEAIAAIEALQTAE